MLDPADESTVKQVLRDVADGGWIVLKRSTKAAAESTKTDIVHNKVRPPRNTDEELRVSSSSEQS